MSDYCYFCDNLEINANDGTPISDSNYKCDICGPILLDEDAAEDIKGGSFSKEDKLAISITLRNEWERNGRKQPEKELVTSDLRNIASQYKPLDPIEKMDQALINIENLTTHVGSRVTIDFKRDYSYFKCDGPAEIRSICELLTQEDFITSYSEDISVISGTTAKITSPGYQRLKDIQQPNRDSKQCFVAMWFESDMDEVFKKAIKPAIEFKEVGQTTSKFEAVKIDNVEHANDINDEIIAQIRRCRFVVCDLTGYRGGVYFEAGFAYGLGLDVIYTCRKDWTKEEILKDGSGNEIVSLFDSEDREINIKKEGVHFDLAHRNRIEWEPDKLDEFKIKLENRIKAVIF